LGFDSLLKLYSLEAVFVNANGPNEHNQKTAIFTLIFPRFKQVLRRMIVPILKNLRQSQQFISQIAQTSLVVMLHITGV
jgi:hypothetical protein